MTEKKKEYGRTLFDVISEHPKKTLLAFLALLLFSIIILLFFVFNGNSVKVGGIEVSSPEKAMIIDTVFKIERETIVIEKPKIISQPVKISKPKKSTTVKKNDIKVEVNDQPANINAGNNSGVIGNNNTINNFGNKPIGLNEYDKAELIKLINIELKKLPKGKLQKITVEGLLGNARSLELAKLIHKFLKEQGYDAGEDIFQSVFTLPKKGVLIQLNDNIVEVIVFIV